MTLDEAYNRALEHWRDNKGVGTFIMPYPLDKRFMVLNVLQKMYNKNPALNVLIITEDFNTRMDLVEFITHQDIEENNNEFKSLLDKKQLRILTIEFISKWVNFMIPDMTLCYNTFISRECTYYLVIKSKFKLFLFDSAPTNNAIYGYAPLLPDFNQKDLDELRISIPVEDIWSPVTIAENTKEYKLLQYYNEYISASMSIFGSIDNMNQARLGNQTLNISSEMICAKIASDNGWSPTLDMSVELNRRIDIMFNPGNIKERANKTFEVMRYRNALLSDSTGKISEILKIVKENEKAKILIINKRAEFASKVTDAINKEFGVICGNYHDKLDNIVDIDSKGNIVRYKSGVKKGQPKMLGSTAQKTRNVSYYNNDKLRILSSNNAPDKDLSISVNVVIITSPACESIKSYLYRLSNVNFGHKLKLYSLYVKNTIEENRLQNKELLPMQTIVNNCEQEVLLENNLDFVIAD